MSGFAGFAGYGVCASTEPASMSDAEETSEMMDLFMSFSFVTAAEGTARSLPR
jgi:hypothetical protein